MDEPSAWLDEDSVERVLSAIGACKAAGKTLVIVSHRARVISELADFLCVVTDGKVANFGPADQVAPLVGGELAKRVRAGRGRSGESAEKNSIDDPDGTA